MDKLTSLLSFIRVIENGSISSAARSLNLSQPAVSQHLNNLENELQVKLLSRTTRSIVLTEAGEIYYTQVNKILENLQEADRSVLTIDQQMTGTLRIGAPTGFATIVLAQFFIDFKKRYPNLTLDLDLTDQYVDFQAHRLDVAIRLGNILDERLKVKKLGSIKRRLAATPEYLNRKGRPSHPDDLLDHDYILYSHLITGDRIPLTSNLGKKVNIKVTPSLITNNSSFLKLCVLGGIGIGLGHESILAAYTKNGELEYVLPDWTYDPHDINIIYAANRNISIKVKRFIEEVTTYMNSIGAFD